MDHYVYGQAKYKRVVKRLKKELARLQAQYKDTETVEKP